jgi:hypothetical protein
MERRHQMRLPGMAGGRPQNGVPSRGERAAGQAGVCVCMRGRGPRNCQCPIAPRASFPTLAGVRRTSKETPPIRPLLWGSQEPGARSQEPKGGGGTGNGGPKGSAATMWAPHAPKARGRVERALDEREGHLPGRSLGNSVPRCPGGWRLGGRPSGAP